MGFEVNAMVKLEPQETENTFRPTKVRTIRGRQAELIAREYGEKTEGSKEARKEGRRGR